MIRQTLMALSLVTAAPLLAGARAAPLTAEQRAEVVQVVRQALINDPSILRDAMANLQADETKREQAAAAGAIATQRAELVAQPADQVIGNPNGSVTVVEFYDPRCPYCRQMLPVFDALVKADPQVRVVYKEIPILGPASVAESRALLAAQSQGRYLALQDALMRTPGAPSAADVRGTAVQHGIDGAAYDRDLANPAIDARLQRNLHLAAELHIDGTPAIVVGQHLFSGAMELADLQRAIATARGG